MVWSNLVDPFLFKKGEWAVVFDGLVKQRGQGWAISLVLLFG